MVPKIKTIQSQKLKHFNTANSANLHSPEAALETNNLYFSRTYMYSALIQLSGCNTKNEAAGVDKHISYNSEPDITFE